MTDKLRAAAEMALEALEDAQEAYGNTSEWFRDRVETLRQALDQLPDTTKMIDTGVDRGAWDDVPDATKWVDELRGDDPSNSTTDVVGPEPVAWLWKNKDGHQVITDDPDYADGTWVPLYTAPPKPDLLNQTCCECWGKATKREWQGLTDEDIIDLQKASWVDKQAFESVAWMIDEHLEKKNSF